MAVVELVAESTLGDLVRATVGEDGFVELRRSVCTGLWVEVAWSACESQAEGVELARALVAAEAARRWPVDPGYGFRRP